MTDIVHVAPDGTHVVLVPTEPTVADFTTGGPVEGIIPWKDFLDAFNFVEEQNVEQAITQLLQIRNIGRDTDEAVLRQTCKLIGFDLSDDFYKLSSGDLLRIVNQLPLYVENSSNVNWNKFLDLILNARTNVSYLWTNDYKSFHKSPQGDTIEHGGSWFKTTHVEFQIEMKASQDLITQVFGGRTQTLGKHIERVFYEYAPVTLVVERVIMNHTFDVPLYWTASLSNYIHEYVDV